MLTFFSRYLPPALLLCSKYRLPLTFKSLPSKKGHLSTTRATMKSAGGKDPLKDPKSNPNISKLQETLEGSSSTDGWDKCWEQGATPWDLHGPVPVILDLLRTGALPKGRVLVPGCGSGYDVVAMAGPERYVVGLDISKNAVKKAMEADFFMWHPSELFDLIFDYTFFCAIEPSMRSAWASRVQDLLKPDGELITLMFPISDHVGGPPYKVSVADYEEVLFPMGFEAISIIDNELAIKPRKGREKLGRWKKRSLKQSLL